MRTAGMAALAAWVIVGAVGCGQSETSPSTAAGGGAVTADQVATSPEAPSDPIARVVFDFLDAVRRGDTAAASGLLTPLALQRTSEMDFVFAPPGSSTARFEVGAAEVIEKDTKAVVDSVWTDLDADGQPQSEPTLWALRFTDGQWRISGMAAEMGPDQPLMVIDFENPETMAPEKPVDPKLVAGPPSSAPATEAAGEVARNPFDQPAQR